MKVITLLLFFASISIINSGLEGFTQKTCKAYDNKTEENLQAFSKDFCRTLGVEDPEHKCCYVKYERDSRTYYNCYEVTQAQFYNIKSLRDDLKSSRGLKTIECDSSSYLYGSLILILALLL